MAGDEQDLEATARPRRTLGRGRSRRDGRGWMAAFIASTTLLALFGGITLVKHLGSSTPQTFLEIYVTDLPADFSRLDVRIAGVYVGDDKVPLDVERPNFDLLSLRGPGDALRVASGPVPVGDHEEVRIVFEAARAELDHKRIHAVIPEQELLVSHDFRLEDGAPRALLFDIDVNESLEIVGPLLMFRPSVASIYNHAFHEPTAETGGATTAPPPAPEPDFSAMRPETPRDQRLVEPTPETQPRSPWTTTPAPEPTDNASEYRETYYHGDPPPEEPANETANDTDTNTSEEALPTVGGTNSVPEDYARTIFGWFVQFLPEVNDTESMDAVLEAYGAEVLYRLNSLNAAYIQVTPPTAEDVYYDPNVTWLEPDMPVHLLLGTSKTAVRVPEVQNPVTGLRDAAGNLIDGRGVGVAVVDSGIDGLHPDLTHKFFAGEASPIVYNFKVESIALHDQVYTDSTSGHGTHVAGIVAGQGIKDPSMRGVAPKAKLYGFGIGEASTLLWPNQAFDWILTHRADQNPPIRVVTNSWGTVGPYEPNSVTTQLVKQMVAAGIVVVFAAGNEPLPAGADTTARECKIPTPGVVCVGAYDDLNTGTRTGGRVGDYASHGADNDPATWPDLVAPGTAIRSCRTPFGWVTGVGLLDYYVELKGTSMAAPHVAGAAALMLQARPGLTPAQVETVLESTAYKFGTPVYVNGGHPARGAGLLDAYAAVAAAKAM